jgi:hypothetical protein
VTRGGQKGTEEGSKGRLLRSHARGTEGFGEDCGGVADFVGADGVGAAGIATQCDLGVHAFEDVGGFLDSYPGDVGVGIAAAEEGGRSLEVAGVVHGHAERADEASGEGEEPGVARGVGGDEFGGETCALGEAADDDAVGGYSGVDGELDGRFDFVQCGGEPRFVLVAGRDEAIGVPAVAFGGGREVGEVGVVHRLGEVEDVVGRGSAAVEHNDCSGRGFEGWAEAVDWLVFVGVGGHLRAIIYLPNRGIRAHDGGVA